MYEHRTRRVRGGIHRSICAVSLAILGTLVVAWPEIAQAQDPGELEGLEEVEELDVSGSGDLDDVEELEALADLSLEALMELAVESGSFLEPDLHDSPMSISIITRAQIQSSGARNLSELLEIYVPGFQYMINKWNGVIWGMRGVATDRNTKILFMINGVAQNLQSSHGSFTETYLGLLDDIERVEVLRGPAGMVYGAGSIAGVVNVVTRTPDENTATVKAGMGTMVDPELQALGNLSFGEGRGVTGTFGLRNSRGLGNRTGRVYGSTEWPTTGVPNPDGNPTDGSPWASPLGVRAGLDLRWDEWRLFTRYTRQAVPTGAFFIVDPWPEITGVPPADAEPKVVDGRVVLPTDPLANTESFGANRRLHQVDNVTVAGEYRRDIGADEFLFAMSWVGATDRLVSDYRKGYAVPDVTPKAGEVIYTFGERRYTARSQYLLQRVDKLKMAFGFEYRLDDIGKDLTGRNQFGGVDAHYFVKDVVYHNVGLYSEAMYSPWRYVSFEAGLRLDKHTRTPLIANPRASIIGKPNDDNVIKLIFQSSSNNGQADFYEYDWTSVTDDGTLITSPVLENPSDPNSAILRGSSRKERRSLRPERAYSVELTSTHRAAKGLMLSPSVSWTELRNVFAWNSDLFRAVNAGGYGFVAVEGVLTYDLDDRLSLGLNHSYEVITNADLGGKTSRRTTVTVVDNGDGTYRAEENPDDFESFQTRPVYDQVTRDGRTFVNLSNNATKAWITYRPLHWLELHTNARAFWGLNGRRGMWAGDLDAGENYLGLQRSSSVMVKWTMSAHFFLTPTTRLSVWVHDILGRADNRHAVRFQQTAADVQRGLYTVDQTSLFVALSHEF